MFTNQRYCTCGIMDEIPEEIQTELWILIEKCRKSKKLELSYSQVFQLSKQGGKQKIVHGQEQPNYRNEIFIDVSCHPVENAKIFVIDDGSYATMMLAREY